MSAPALIRAFKDPFSRFVLVGIGLWLGWLLLYHQWIHPWGALDRLVINSLMDLSGALLTAFGYELLPEPGIDLERYIGVQGGSLLWIGDPCNGIKIFAVLAVFVIAFPGPWRHKAWFIPAGIALVHLLNAIRVAVLCIVVTQGYGWLEFNHDYTFYVVVYGAVFGLMWLWVRRFSGWKRPSA